MAERRVHRYGEGALLVEADDTSEVLGLVAALQSRPVAGQQELVPGARSLLVRVDGGTERAAVDLASRRVSDIGRAVPEPVTLDVLYDGEDLAEVGALTGLGAAGVVAAHTGQVWTVAFGGFAPGFGYLIGDGSLAVPRRATPRTRVPAGAVGLAGTYSGVYPRESPGGWQLIGRTAAPLWDLDRDPPALLRPGVAVRFRAVDELPAPAIPPAPAQPAAARGFEVVRPGILTTIQDSGRPGWAAAGVTGSGAADRAAYERANALVGNDSGAAALETTLGGLRLRALGDHVVAITGAPVPVTVRHPDGVAESVTTPWLELRSGDLLELGTADRGLRSYLAVDGGVEVPAVLGSRSTDLLSGIGPAVLARGQLLPVGPARHPVGSATVAVSVSVSVAPSVGPAPSPGVSVPPVVDPSAAAWSAEMVTLSVTPGPHPDRLEPAALAGLTGREWQVTPQSNRVGLRLAGTPIGVAAGDEMPSAPLVPGAVQVPPSGLPVIFLRDHPTTGGYPVLAVLTDASIDLAAQLRPGRSVRFVLV